jgi:hypothetical protein
MKGRNYEGSIADYLNAGRGRRPIMYVIFGFWFFPASVKK